MSAPLSSTSAIRRYKVWGNLQSAETEEVLWSKTVYIFSNNYHKKNLIKEMNASDVLYPHK